MSTVLNTPITTLRGVSDNKAKIIRAELGISTLVQLIHYFPFRYIDRSKIQTVNEISETTREVQLKGKAISITKQKLAKGFRTVVVFRDSSGTVELIWFKIPSFIQDILKSNEELIVFGKVDNFRGKWQISHPEIEKLSTFKAKNNQALLPVYPSGEKLKKSGVNNNFLTKIVREAIHLVFHDIQENLSTEIINSYNFLARNDTFLNIHFPKSINHSTVARYRLKFEELFFQQLFYQYKKNERKKVQNGLVFDQVGQKFNEFYTNYIPFELTIAQKRVIKEIRADLGSGSQMNRLLQGDVGSGKTLVALMSMLLAIDNGYQSCMMVPTEVLAFQHFESVSTMVNNLDLNVELLTGSIKGKKRVQILEQLEKGEIDILIGTHALIQDPVLFKDLGLAIIDEQHRFGVEQRSKLWKKNSNPPHILVMTATPIPRTLYMATDSAELDVSKIDELPKNRTPIITKHVYEYQRDTLFGLMKREMTKGRQVFVVYPLIEENNVMPELALEEGYEKLTRSFPLEEYAFSVVHGKMKPADKDAEMQRFANGETQIMVATTVIEVGVNVPNATLMVIENSERFGLAQLHQLRGRVGRGEHQSYCVLVSKDQISRTSKKRLEVLLKSTDGFYIAEQDMYLRGYGNVLGTQQSGVAKFLMADLDEDKPILVNAYKTILQMLEKDPMLQSDTNLPIQRFFVHYMSKNNQWASIS